MELFCVRSVAVAALAAALASRSGAIATALMTPKHGRAGWIGERAKGFEDAGATVIAVLFESLI